ncbi:hypothetical protein [[Eubacterium] cellulosolvens]
MTTRAYAPHAPSFRNSGETRRLKLGQMGDDEWGARLPVERPAGKAFVTYT